MNWVLNSNFGLYNKLELSVWANKNSCSIQFVERNVVFDSTRRTKIRMRLILSNKTDALDSTRRARNLCPTLLNSRVKRPSSSSTQLDGHSKHNIYRKIFDLIQILIVDTLISKWISSSNQRWIARHYLLTRLIHSTRLIIIISIWWLDESFQLTIHSRIDNHLIDHIISRFYLMTFNDYMTNRVFNMWAKYLTCEKIENHLYKTLCNHLIKNIHHLIQAST